MSAWTLAQYSSFLLRPLIDAHFCPLSVLVSAVLSRSYPLLVKYFFRKVHPLAVPLSEVALHASVWQRVQHTGVHDFKMEAEDESI